MFGDDGDEWVRCRAYVQRARWPCVDVMSHKPRRKRRVNKEKNSTDDLTKVERVFEELRQIQWQTNCSSKTLQTFLDALRGNLGRMVREIDEEIPGSVKYADSKMQKMVIIS